MIHNISVMTFRDFSFDDYAFWQMVLRTRIEIQNVHSPILDKYEVKKGKTADKMGLVGLIVDMTRRLLTIMQIHQVLS